MKKPLLLIFYVTLFASFTYGLEYEIISPCQATLNEPFTITTLFKNAAGEIAVGYELPDSMKRDTAELTGVTNQDSKVDGNTHKWTFKTTEDKVANVSMRVVPTKEGEYTFYIYTILPPGKEQRDSRTITIRGKQPPMPQQTPEEQQIQESSIQIKEQKTNWPLLIQIWALLGTVYYFIYKQQDYEKNKTEEEGAQIPDNRMDSYQQTKI